MRTQGRKGDDGSHTAIPPPCRGTTAAPRACAVLATCLRQRTDSEDAPPHPTPFSSTHPRKRRGQRGDSEGTWGGGQRTDRNAGGRDEWRWRAFMRRRRRPTLHHAVKDKRVTVLGPVTQPEMDFMSHRGITHA